MAPILMAFVVMFFFVSFIFLEARVVSFFWKPLEASPAGHWVFVLKKKQKYLSDEVFREEWWDNIGSTLGEDE